MPTRRSQLKPGRYLAVDFSPTMTEVVWMEVSSSSRRLLGYDLLRLPKRMEDPRKAQVQFLKDFLKKNRISSRHAVLSISDPDSIWIQQLTLPELPVHEIPDAIKWQLKDDVPFDLDRAMIDWQVVKTHTDSEGAKKQDLVLILAKRETVDKCLSYLNQASLHCARIVSGPFNYHTLLKEQGGSDAVYAVLEIDFKDSVLGIYVNGQLHFVRRVPVSWEKLTRSLTEILTSNKGRIEITFEEAEDLECRVGIPQDGTQVVQDHIQASHVISLMRPVLEALVRELKFSFHYFSSSLEAQRPAKLYLTGCGANLKNLGKYLTGELGVETDVLKIPEKIAGGGAGGESWETARNVIVNAVGSVLDAGQSVNLLPREIREQRSDRVKRAGLGFMALIMITVSLYLFMSAQFLVMSYKGRIKNAKVHLETVSGIQEIEKKINLRKNLIRAVERDRVPASGVLRILSVAVPDKIKLEDILLDQRNHTFLMKGIVLANEQTAGPVLTDFMQTIEDTPFFAEASLVSSNGMAVPPTFEVRCDFPREKDR